MRKRTVLLTIAHVVLGHPLIPLCLKTEEEAIEELEADEFAGRIHIPKWLLFSCNYYSFSKLAEYLLVSGAALFIRLSNLKSLYIRKSKIVDTVQGAATPYFLQMQNIAVSAARA